jgi:hypothetical protein
MTVRLCQIYAFICLFIYLSFLLVRRGAGEGVNISIVLEFRSFKIVHRDQNHVN